MALCRSLNADPRLLVFLLVLTLCAAFVRTETVAGSSPTLQADNHDSQSGEGGFDVTTKEPFPELTQNTYTIDYEDSTESLTPDEDGVLGPGAITAIVIAVFLGASVLLALIVITLRKFTAS